MKKNILYLIFMLVCSFAIAQKSGSVITTEGIKPVGVIKNLSDSALLDVVQRQTFRYFWDFAHPVSGLARERSNTSFGYGNEVVTIGGSGFGIMSIIVADHRKWITHDQAVNRISKIIEYLFNTQTA